MDSVIDISAGVDVSYALTETGEVYGWGRNEGFQLGINDNRNRNSPEFIMDNVLQIGIGYRCGYAIDKYGVLWTWGSNVSNKNARTPCIINKDVSFIADNKYDNGILNINTYFIDNDNCVYLWPHKFMYPIIIDNEIDNEFKLPTALNAINNFITEKLDYINVIFEKEFIKQQSLHNKTNDDVSIESKDEKNNTLHYDELYEFQGHSYQCFSELISWKEAKQNCENMGGHLLTITSEAEQKFVENMIGKYYDTCFSIGLYYDGIEGWNWITDEEMMYKKEIKDYVKGVNNLPDLYASDLPYGIILYGEWRGSFVSDIPHQYI